MFSESCILVNRVQVLHPLFTAHARSPFYAYRNAYFSPSISYLHDRHEHSNPTPSFLSKETVLLVTVSIFSYLNLIIIKLLKNILSSV